MQPHNSTLPRHVRHALVEADLSVSEIARRLNRDRTHILRVLRGERVHQGTRARIAQALNVSPDALWSDYQPIHHAPGRPRGSGRRPAA